MPKVDLFVDEWRKVNQQIDKYRKKHPERDDSFLLYYIASHLAGTRARVKQLQRKIHRIKTGK